MTMLAAIGNSSHVAFPPIATMEFLTFVPVQSIRRQK
jgi:hypothetical protein